MSALVQAPVVRVVPPRHVRVGALAWTAVRACGGASGWPLTLAPLGAALLLVLVTLPVLDDGWAPRVLQAAAALLALTVAVAADDPAGELLAASPYRLWVRTLSRAAVAVALCLPVWALLLVVASRRAAALPGGVPLPVERLSVQAAVLAGFALALGLVLARRGVRAPSSTAGPALLLGVVATYQLPAAWGLWEVQPWEAAGFRWAGLALVAAAVVAHALRDPADPRLLGRLLRRA